MSRGLSKNQRRILGIAYSINTCFGCEVDKTGNDLPGYICPVSDYDGIKDIHWAIAANKLFGLEWTMQKQEILKSNGYYQSSGFYFDLTTGEARSAKASSIRAITGLLKQGYLLYAPKYKPFERGYVLTEKGREIGRKNQETVEDWEILRAGFVRNTGGSYYHSDILILASAIRDGRYTFQQVLQRYNDSGNSYLIFGQLANELSVTELQNSAQR